METLKSVGSVMLGIAVFIGIIAAIVLFFAFGAQVAFTIAPFVNWLAGILVVINIIVLLVALIPSARNVAGAIIFFSSYVYGLSTWIYGLAVTLALWGWIAVIVGILLGGIGVVPIGILASMITGHWSMFWVLLATAALTYISRAIGYALLNSTPARPDDHRTAVIEGEVVDEKRSWKDIE